MGEGELVLLVMAAAFAVGVRLSLGTPARTLLRVQRELGFERKGKRLLGIVDGQPVTVETERIAIQAPDEDPRFRANVTAGEPGRIPVDLTVRRSRATEQIGVLLGAKADFATGDADFDASTTVAGHPADLLLLLSPTTRKLLQGLHGNAEVRLEAGVARVSMTMTDNDAALVKGAVRSAVNFAERASVGTLDVAEKVKLLGERMAEEPSPEVRATILKTIAVIAKPEQAAAVLDLSLRTDGDGASALRACTLFRTESERHEALLRVVKTERFDMTIRGRALEMLSHHHDRGEVLPLVEAALASEDDRIRRSAVRILGRWRHAAAAGSLAAIASSSRTNAELGVEIARALAALARAVADGERLGTLEPALRALLASPHREVQIAATRVIPAVVHATEAPPELEDRLASLLGGSDLDLRVAAAKTLGAVGTLRTVAALLAIARAISAPGEIKVAARAAIDAIRGRIGEADAGRLSLADDVQGALSLESGVTGALAFSKDEDPDGADGPERKA